MAVGLSNFRSLYATSWHLLMAASAAMTFPMVLLFLAAQRQFVQGIVLTGMKG